MKPFVVLMGLCFAVGQSLPVVGQEVNVDTNVEIPVDAINQSCEIVLSSATSTSTETNAGKLIRFDNASVVLVDATRTVRVEKGVPILAGIPYLSRLFRNVGIGVENVTGELTIARSDIKSIKLTK